MASETVDTDPLVLGLTRPAMYMGVTQTFMVMNIFATAILFINTKSFLVIPAALILHVFGYLMCLRDQRYFDLLACRIMTTPPRTPPATKKALGGQTYDPF